MPLSLVILDVGTHELTDDLVNGESFVEHIHAFLVVTISHESLTSLYKTQLVDLGVAFAEVEALFVEELTWGGLVVFTVGDVLVVSFDFLGGFDWVKGAGVWLKSAVLDLVELHEDILELVDDVLISPLEHSGSPSFGLLVLGNVCLN